MVCGHWPGALTFGVTGAMVFCRNHGAVLVEGPLVSTHPRITYGYLSDKDGPSVWSSLAPCQGESRRSGLRRLCGPRNETGA